MPNLTSALAALAALAVLMLVPGCLVGGGDGWVTGDLSVAQCRDTETLEKQGDFDLGVGFFAGEAMADPSAAPAQQRNRLTIRLQNASTTVETSDGLMLQFQDTARAAKRFAAGQLLPVSDSSLCAAGCPLAEDLVRGRLYLYNSCPDARQALVAVNRTLAERPASSESVATGKPCLVPSGEEVPGACGDLSASDRASLDALCAGDFSRRDGAAQLASTLGRGGSSCIYLCQFGPARPGQDPASLDGFALDYGEMVAALFSLAIVDGRAIRSAGCTEAKGQIQGMFKFKVQRGLAAQTFP